MTAPALLDKKPANWSTVEAAGNGDMDAFATIYRTYKRRVFAFVLPMAHYDDRLAEDLTADVFVKALVHLGDIEWQGREVHAWLFRVARNTVFDHFRLHRVRRELLTYETMTTLEHGGEVTRAEQIDTDPEGQVEDTVLIRLQGAQLRALVDELPPLQAEVIRHRYLNDRSVEQTSTLMGVTTGAAKALTYRALRALARTIPDGV